jgi:hypothetical protein
MKAQHQAGMATVEFAIVGFFFLMLLFAIIEMGRLFYTFNVLAEVTRRGARMAAVCPVDDPAIANVAIFAPGGGSSPILNGLTTANIDNPAPAPCVPGNPTLCVTVRITGYSHSLFIPGSATSFIVPPFTTTLPVESGGVVGGLATAC